LPGDPASELEPVVQPERPVFFACTVGGAPHPIATALRTLRPAVVWFLVSDRKSGESSRSQAEALRSSDGCPAEIRIFEAPADDPDGAYKIYRSQLMEARRRYSDHRLIADYTGGTKSMTGALLMAAFAEPGFEVQFMAGERADLVQVRSGSEQPRVMLPDFILAERNFAAAEQAASAYDYAAARRLLEALKKDVLKKPARPPKAWMRRLEQTLASAALFADWDAFNHREAAKRAENGSAALKTLLAAGGHLQPLIALGGSKKDQPSFHICADLWLNALRRGERGRYDDAVARLYRLLEATAQMHLWSRYGLESGRMLPSELPKAMRSPSLMYVDQRDGKEYARLALNQTAEFLRCRDKGDRFVAAYAANRMSDLVQGPSWLVKRNHSILAHGFTRITAEDWSAARGWVEASLITFFEKSMFPQLPKAIPPLADS
jgi:CRISPR-associated protein (TIGR02710 family)